MLFADLANSRSLVPQCLSASCGDLACSQQPLIGASMSLCLMWCSCLQPTASLVLLADSSQQPLIGASMPLCLCGALACSQQPLIGCKLLLLGCCLLTSATSLLSLLFLSLNSCSLVPRCLSAYVVQFATGKALAANSRSLAVGCCCLSGVAC